MDEPWQNSRSSSPNSKCRILVAESDRALRATIAAILRLDGYEVIEVANGFELLQVIEASMEAEVGTEDFDLVICDARLSGKSGLHVFSLLGNAANVPPVVFTTTTQDQTMLDEAERLGALAVLERPLDIDELRSLVHRLVTRGTT